MCPNMYGIACSLQKWSLSISLNFVLFYCKITCQIHPHTFQSRNRQNNEMFSFGCFLRCQETKWDSPPVQKFCWNATCSTCFESGHRERWDEQLLNILTAFNEVAVLACFSIIAKIKMKDSQHFKDLLIYFSVSFVNHNLLLKKHGLASSSRAPQTQQE